MRRHTVLVLFCLLGGLSGCASRATPAIDSFCATYERTVLNPIDLASVRKLPVNVRRRIQGNDLEYLCACKGWKDKACR